MRKKVYKVFNFSMTFDEGWRLCKAFGGEMWLPLNSTDYEKHPLIHNETHKLFRFCDSNIWIPIKR